MMKINWTDSKVKKIKKLIEDYVNEHKVTCGEAVIQMDNPTIDSPRIMADIVDVLKPKGE